MKSKVMTICAALTMMLAMTALAVGDTTDLWDVNQGSIVTGTSTAGVYQGSDIRNMFGGEYGTIEVGNTIFYDAQIFSPGSVALVSWKTPTSVDLSRFVLSAAADGVYPYVPSTYEIPLNYNRSIQGFKLYASNSNLDTYADWGTAIYDSGLLAQPGTFAGGQGATSGLYYYTIDHTFSTPVSAQYFKADIIYGSYVTGPRIIELDGYRVPEPATLTMLGAGVLGILLKRRRNT
jgi:hypothetical protein